MVALKDWKKNWLPATLEKYMMEPGNFLIPYFSRSTLYFMDDHIFAQMTTGQEAQFKIDYTLTLDTNMVTYVDALIQGRSLEKVPEAEHLLTSILYDNLNFDSVFYMVENLKTVRKRLSMNPSSAIQFWKSLNRDFRKNMVSFQLFRSIDCAAFKATGVIKSMMSYCEAVHTAVQYSYDFYARELGSNLIQSWELRQKVLLLHLIAILRIQIASAKSPKNKMKEYFKFVHEVTGAYADREAIIAHKFFCDRKSISMLEQIKKGTKKTGLLRKLDNIAWDMSAPRFLEKIILSGGDGRYIIPMFLTLDANLRQMLKAYPVKGVLFNRKTGAFVPLPEIRTEEYFEKHGCAADLEHLYSEPMRSERLSRKSLDLPEVFTLIKSELKKLQTYMA
ncbi:hypothetical protein D0T23_23505 [Duganella sp. BJB475]|nr:hypothetical protein D0T23_23505 [Duganella sp. BJB475]